MSIAVYIRNESFLDHVRRVLLRAGFKCEHFATEIAFMRGLRRSEFELILIDVPVEPSDDDAILSWLNCRPVDNTPVLVTSPLKNAFVAALYLNSGADDFLYRPFEPIEFIARTHALLRRVRRRSARTRIELAGFHLDREAARFQYRGEPIELTPREFSIAWLLFSSPGVFISRETISVTIWSTDSEVAGRTIEQHIYKLRKKLCLGPDRGVVLRTAYNQGYRLEVLDKPQDDEGLAG
ncbi:MAG TPA: response regulator transcription factor [Noviherbaspirillum sp.]|jgi:DNA-binding response OmpR family regulator|uniref:response regulator transcription factor n=1 Tax=Noviherbaspirillum sp. TaxID=1926288 RepID=UPI002F94CB14